MATKTTDWRRELKDYTKRELSIIFKVTRGGVLVLLGVLLGYALFADHDGYGYWANLFTEGISVVFTIVVLNTFADRREQKRLLRDLIAQMRSHVNEEAIRATEELGRHEWLYDGSLRDADLRGANLEKAPLEKADLQSALLSEANLKRAQLTKAKLQGVVLNEAELRGARFEEADLRKASLVHAKLEGNATLFMADLQGADLFGADLRGAELRLTNLQDARLRKTIFDENTQLPDGTKWTSDTDIARFTDPTHDPFWRPEPGEVWWYPANVSG